MVVAVALHVKPAVKQSIAHNMGLRQKLVDVAGCWEKLVASSVDGKIANKDNFDAINKALGLQTGYLQQIAAAVDNEYVYVCCIVVRLLHKLVKQTNGYTKPLGWKLIQYMESNPKLNPEFGISHETVRKQEKEMMTYDIECTLSALDFVNLCSMFGAPCSMLACSLLFFSLLPCFMLYCYLAPGA